MVRGWGPTGGANLSVPGMEVTILQKLPRIPIAETHRATRTAPASWSSTRSRTATRAAAASVFELKSRAALVTDFLIENDICDFRAFSPTDPVPTGNFQLNDFSTDSTLEVDVSNPSMMGLFEADDVFRYGQNVLALSAKRARMTGYWANTFTPDRNPTQWPGEKKVWTACLNFGNSVSDALTGGGLRSRRPAGDAVPPAGIARTSSGDLYGDRHELRHHHVGAVEPTAQPRSHVARVRALHVL